MGVINLTPDSFSDGGELNSSKKVLDQVNHFLSNGVDVIDLGAQRKIIQNIFLNLNSNLNTY